MKFEATIGEVNHEIEKDNSGIKINGKSIHHSLHGDGDFFTIQINNKSHEVELTERNGNLISFKVNGKSVSIDLKDETDLLLSKLGMNQASETKVNNITSPMPGTIIEILVEKGQSVSKGESLLVLEAMKMENAIKSPTDGVIADIHVSKGENVEKNRSLISFE